MRTGVCGGSLAFMRFETLANLQIPKMGFGTWRIGGGMTADHKIEVRSLGALRSALEMGYKHFDTAEMYADGHAEVLLGQAVIESRAPRESLFITSKVMPSHLRYEEVMRACEHSLSRLRMDYLDLYLIHWSAARMDLRETFRALNKLVRDGLVRYLGVSNFDLAQLIESKAASETPIITNQIPYSIADRSYINNGVIGYCQENDILITAYSPFEEGRLKTSAALDAIAAAHHATPHQIALAWLIQQPRVVSIPMSFSRVHQKENLDAVEIILTDAEMKMLS